MTILCIQNIHSFLSYLKKTVLRVTEDGSSFYRALAISEYNSEEFHKSIRYYIMNRIQSNSNQYISYFEDAHKFYFWVLANREDGAWPDCAHISSIILTIIPELYNIHLVIYDFIEGNKEIGVYKYGNPQNRIVELLRTNNMHYDLLSEKLKID